MSSQSTSRRKFIAASGALLGAQWVNAQAVGAAADEKELEQVFKKNATVYKFKIGDAEAWSISDGYFAARQGLKLMYPEEQREQMKEALKINGEPDDRIPLYVNILVIRKGKHVLVFDSGFGAPEASWKGWFMDGLNQIGIAPDDVTACFLSHAHIDHIAGFLTDGKPTFKNAPVYVTPEEYRFWTSDNPDFSMSRRDPKAIPGMVKGIKKHFADLSTKIVEVKAGTTLLDGLVTVHNGFGHTPGHAYYSIKSGGEELIHIADLAHHHVLMFENPDWVLAWDHNPKLALQTRKSVFTELSKSHARVYGFHLAFPGLGTVVKQGEGFRWAAERATW